MTQARDIQEAKTGSKLIVLKGVGHIPQIEDVAQFNAAVSSILKKLK